MTAYIEYQIAVYHITLQKTHGMLRYFMHDADDALGDCLETVYLSRVYKYLQQNRLPKFTRYQAHPVWGEDNPFADGNVAYSCFELPLGSSRAGRRSIAWLSGEGRLSAVVLGAQQAGRGGR